MSISKKLDETLESLDLTSAAQEARDNLISQSLGKFKGKMSGLDIQVESEKPKVELKPKPGRFADANALATAARQVYRDNIKPKDVEKKEFKDQPSTIASRANVRALRVMMARLRLLVLMALVMLVNFPLRVLMGLVMLLTISIIIMH